MNKFQSIQFRTLDDFYEYISGEEKSIVLSLREIILEAIPECREKLAYNVPFFYRKKRLAYIWPASVPWGGLNEGVSIGFTKGHLMDDPEELLNGKDKKEIRTLHYTRLSEINREQLLFFLFQAEALDQERK